MTRITGRLMATAFDRRAAAKVRSEATYQAVRRGPVSSQARRYVSTEIIASAAHGKYGWHEAQATTSVRSGCAAKRATARPEASWSVSLCFDARSGMARESRASVSR